MEHVSHNNLEKNLESIIKYIGNVLKKYFGKFNKYLGFSGWIIFGLIVLVFLLVIHYQNKIDNIQSSKFIYYERPLRIDSNVKLFDHFDEYFNRQNKYFNDLFENHEKTMNTYRNFLNSDRWIVDTSKNSQQMYQKYYLYDGKTYSYKINYNNGFVNGDLVINDSNKKDMLINKIQELSLRVSDSGANIVFSGKTNNINSLLNVLD